MCLNDIKNSKNVKKPKTNSMKFQKFYKTSNQFDEIFFKKKRIDPKKPRWCRCLVKCSQNFESLLPSIS